MRPKSIVLKKFLAASLFTVLGSVSTQLFSILFISFLAKKMDSNFFAELIYLLTTVQMFAILASGGIGLALTKFTAENISKNNRIFIISAAQINILFSILAILILLFSFHFIGLKNELQNHVILVIGILSISADAFLKSLLIGKKKFAKFSIVSFINAAILFASNFIFYFYGGGDFIKFGFILGYSLILVLSILLFLSEERWFNYFELIKFKLTVLIELSRFATPLLLSNLLVIYVNWHIQFTMNSQGRLNELAMFGVINQSLNLLLFLPVIFNKVALPFLVDKNFGNSDSKIFTIMKKSFMGFLIIFFLLIISKTFFISGLSFFFGERYDLDRYYYLLIFYAFLSSLSSVIGNVLAAKSDLFFGLVLNSIWTCTVLICLNVFSSNLFSVLESLILGFLLITVIGYIKLSPKIKYYFWRYFMSIVNLIPYKIKSYHETEMFINSKEEDWDKPLVIMIDYDLFINRKEKKLGDLSYKCGIEGINYIHEFCLQNNLNFIRVETTDNVDLVQKNIKLNSLNYIKNCGTDISVLTQLTKFIEVNPRVIIVNSSCSEIDAFNFKFFLETLNSINHQNYVLGFNANSKTSPKLPILNRKYPHIITNYFSSSNTLILKTLKNDKSRILNKLFKVDFKDKLYCIRYFESYLSNLALNEENGDLYLISNLELLSYKKKPTLWPKKDSRILRILIENI
ncbi:MAG: oligosaccharide flippase family protein [Crocinitomicaceae bacterium]|nr:oligosaccharide flippase family protein [Crocinitomicaceae bacterium]MBP6032365.1 oligosaccharide flippase family protein [Crocinitomicaceae bacterium]